MLHSYYTSTRNHFASCQFESYRHIKCAYKIQNNFVIIITAGGLFSPTQPDLMEILA